MRRLSIGLMSGTSLDGLDITLVSWSRHLTPTLIHAETYPFPESLKNNITQLTKTLDETHLVHLATTDLAMGQFAGESVNNFLKKHQLNPVNIEAIGSHGQTILHRPNLGFSLQIGDPNTIAALTRITTVANFRQKDLCLGGQGAPLVPAFHQHMFAQTGENIAILNLGGIANLTLLNGDNPTLGFDTGPGNGLLDKWTELHLHKPYDADGKWAKLGQIQPALLTQMLNDDYFAQPAPKSTGFEHFNLNWLKQFDLTLYRPVDVQATLLELTCVSIVNALNRHQPECTQIVACGGGVHNAALMEKLCEKSRVPLLTSNEKGINPDWVEAMAFAYFALNTLDQKPSNLPVATGASRKAILGGIYYP